MNLRSLNFSWKLERVPCLHYDILTDIASHKIFEYFQRISKIFEHFLKDFKRFSNIFQHVTNDDWAKSNFFSLTAFAGTSNVILGLNLLCQTKSDRSQQLPSTNNWTVSLLWLSWMIRLETLCRSLFLSLEFDKLTRFDICTLQSDIICCSADDDPRPSDFRFQI